MGKASSSKKVARAAGASGGRTARGRAPVLWYAALLVIILGGAGITAFSRQERQDLVGDPKSQTPPRANQDHWHVAYGVYDCDKWLDPVTDQTDASGIHTHGDGVMHVHPFVSKVAGKNSTVGKFTTQVKAKIDATSFTWPAGSGSVTRRTGNKCGDIPGVLKVFYDGKPVTGDPKLIRFTDRGKLVVAFVAPDKTLETIGDAPSFPNLDNLTDVSPTTPAAVPGAPADPNATTPPTATPSTALPGEPGATTTPGSPAPAATTAPPATAAPASTATTAK